jgi:DNA transposition AAA+ family ATPase
MTVIDLAERRQSASDVPFVETSVSRDIFRLASLAIAAGSNIRFVGAPGVGKSRALAAFAGSRNDVAMARLTPACRSLKAMMATICGALGIYGDGPPLEMARRICVHDWPYAAVILDEAQYLDEERMDQLAHMSATDEGRLVFITCGNPHAKQVADTNTGKHAGISRRFMRPPAIDGITQADADAITNAFGVEGMDAYRLMRAVGAVHHADGIVNVLRFARLAGAKTITARHIESTLQALPQYRPAPAKR